MLSNFHDVPASNVHNRATNTLRRFNYDVVVLRHVEGIQSFDFLPCAVENTLIDGVRDTVVDQLRENQPIFTLVKHLEGIGREWESASNIRIASENSVDVTGKLCPLVFVDGVGDIG